MSSLKPGILAVGVIGIGFGQQVHVPAVRSDPRCRVEAICASTRERAARVAERLCIPNAYGDWRELVEDPRIDAVTIAAPPSVQPAMAVAALERGKAVFCEKPMAASLEAAQRAAGAAERAGVANMVDFEFPELAPWQRAKSMLEEGAIGGLRHVAVSWQVETYANRMGLDSWKTQGAEGGGTLNGFVAHSFSYLEWLLGPVARLWASLHGAPHDQRLGDTLDVLSMETASGVPVSLVASSQAFLGHGHRVELYGADGTLVLDNPTTDYVSGFRLLVGTRSSGRLEPVDSIDAAPEACDGRVAPVAGLVRRFADWITEDVATVPSFKEGLRVQGLLEAAQRSHQSGRWVDCPG